MSRRDVLGTPRGPIAPDFPMQNQLKKTDGWPRWLSRLVRLAQIKLAKAAVKILLPPRAPGRGGPQSLTPIRHETFPAVPSSYLLFNF